MAGSDLNFHKVRKEVPFGEENSVMIIQVWRTNAVWSDRSVQVIQVNAPQIIGVTLELCTKRGKFFFLDFWQHNLIGNVILSVNFFRRKLFSVSA